MEEEKDMSAKEGHQTAWEGEKGKRWRRMRKNLELSLAVSLNFHAPRKKKR